MDSSMLNLLWAYSITLIVFLPTANFPALSFPFLPHNNVTLYGDAYFINHAISLTTEHACPLPSSSSSSPSPSSSSTAPYSGIGRAFYVYPVRFLDAKTNSIASFSCRFSFSIVPSPLCPAGDGIAFVITSNLGSFSRENGHLGLPELDPSFQDSFFAVEFDTNLDPSVGDINGNHVGVDVSSHSSSTSVDAYSNGIDLSSGRHLTAWIEYRDSSKMIRVWLSYYLVRPPNPILAAHIDLSKHLKEFMHVGFSAANGNGSAIHVVDSWRFKTFMLGVSSMPLQTLEEGDCFMCFTEESSTVNAEFESKNKKTPIKIIALVIAVMTILIVVILGVIVVYCVKKDRAKREREEEQHTNNIQLYEVPVEMSINEIRLATAGFSKNRIIGEGGSSFVYRGFLNNGKQVAIKRLKSSSRSESFTNPFFTEFHIMTHYRTHRNLVQLLGWCREQDELILVFEYLCNGSLDKILHRSSSSLYVLTWEQRLNIVLGIASALTYLHEECDTQIIHRDVKSCNVMLDSDFTAKLGDFGLAEAYDHGSILREATIPAGTMGCMAPEYAHTGVPTVKTDVFSFGVLVLEVASGRKPLEEDNTTIHNWMWDLWEKRKMIEAIDCRFGGKYSTVEMERLVKVGLCCVHPNCDKRPTVKEAAMMLRDEIEIPPLPAKKPKLRLKLILPEGSREIMESTIGHGIIANDSPWLTPRTHFAPDIIE